MKKIVLAIFFIFYSLLLIYGLKKDGTKKVVLKTDDLYEKIENYANSFNKEMIDSRYDNIWKRVPGLNGIEVDILNSYLNMKDNNYFIKEKIIYKDVLIKTELSSLPLGPIYRGNEIKNDIALLINVSWGEEHILDILKILNKKNVKASFFIEGNFALNNKNLVKIIAEEGHEIGSHSLKHLDFTKINYNDALKDLSTTNDILTSITNKKITLFSPPSGALNNNALEAANKLNMQTILFDVDTIDWQNPSKEIIIQRVKSKVRNGSFILMHPCLNTKLALEELIDYLKTNYNISKISEVISPTRSSNQ